jgi:hypothetical protein
MRRRLAVYRSPVSRLSGEGFAATLVAYSLVGVRAEVASQKVSRAEWHSRRNEGTK